MSIALKAPRVARRRFMSGVAIVALVAASFAVVRLRERLAPVSLPRLEDVSRQPRAHTMRSAPSPILPLASARARVPLASAESGRVRVMLAPELRIEHAMPPEYSIVKERILIEPERRLERAEGQTQIIPARYGYRERRVETRPARVEIETLPAVWEWREGGQGRSG